MNQNGRRIALSLVAIVLGAGFLMRVIPRETDVGTDEAHSLQIDGSLVTNPLDINELPHNISLAGLPPYSVLSTPGAQDSASNKEPLFDAPSAPPHALSPDGSATNDNHLPDETAPHGESLPSSPGSTPAPHLPVPVNNDSGGNGSTPGSGGGGGAGGGAGGGGANPTPTVPPIIGGGENPSPIPPFGSNPLPPSEFPSDPQGPGNHVPPVIDLPTDPRDLDPKGRDPIDDGAGPIPPLEVVVIPVEIPDDEPTPSHSVPESGSTTALLSLALITMAEYRRRTRRLA